MNALSKEKRMSIRSSAAVILSLRIHSPLPRTGSARAPEAGPEQKKLEQFVGTWRVEGEIKPNDYMPAGKNVSTHHIYVGSGGILCRVAR
jgi:hypothetical protein